jgi:hypothetical protein
MRVPWGRGWNVCPLGTYMLRLTPDLQVSAQDTWSAPRSPGSLRAESAEVDAGLSGCGHPCKCKENPRHWPTVLSMTIAIPCFTLATPSYGEGYPKASARQGESQNGGNAHPLGMSIPRKTCICIPKGCTTHRRCAAQAKPRSCVHKRVLRSRFASR